MNACMNKMSRFNCQDLIDVTRRFDTAIIVIELYLDELKKNFLEINNNKNLCQPLVLGLILISKLQCEIESLSGVPFFNFHNTSDRNNNVDPCEYNIVRYDGSLIFICVFVISQTE